MKQILQIMLVSIATLLQSMAQSGVIKGQIQTHDGKPAEAVNVQLSNTNKGTISNADGVYRIERVKSGNYTLKVSLIGLETKEQKIEVKAGQTLTVDFTLAETANQLQEVVISAKNQFAQKESDYIAKMPIKNLENPQAYNVVSKELLKEQLITSFDDAIKNAPGVNRLWTATGRGGDGAGYFSMRGFSVQPTMINGVAGQTNGGIDPANIERIESIKGPSGTLFGSSLISFGGLLNIVTKKPYESFGGEASYSMGGFDLSRLTLDINTPIGTDQTALFRINGATNYQGSFQDAGFRQSSFVAPSLTYKVNDKLSLNITTEYMTQTGTNPLMIFLNRTRKLIATNPSELQFDYKRSYTSNDITITNNTLNIFGQANYTISDKWTSQTNISRSVRKSDGYYSYIMYRQATNDTLVNRFISNQNATGTTTNIQQNFIGDFTIGKIRNRLIVGLDYLQLVTHNNSTDYIQFDQVNTSKANDTRYALLTKAALDAKLAVNTAPTKSQTDSRTYSAYLSDVVNINEKLMLMMSLRFDHFENIGTTNFATGITTGNYNQSAVSPKLGIVYQLLKDKVSLFGNYMNGFRNVAPVIQPLADLDGTFKPQQANQYEGGVKLDLLQSRLSLTASYYDIMVNNMTRSEVLIRDGKQYNVTVQDGSQQSKGVEFDLVANPINGLNIVLGYAHNDSKQLKVAESLLNRRPTSAGPADLVNFWASYTFIDGKIKGLGLGFGGNYVSKNEITNNAITGVFTLPSYTVLNATVFYGIQKFRIGLKVDNLTNKEYFGGWSTVEPQMPRRLMGSVTFKF
ncbi:iron complex outermembrane receptor protein [Arcicella aurantiaca]|uniref:Iron complex outermembrane receptor protein n=1 Tax=Arcicella aurantiaca TaxID=591202 RepID=A0A316DPA8_9BACT|nr:TonB-dependent receptor [Arcicella aurantiaca]PWK20057.1 iron complex outermembrane receptor protein [Arcicella aurantiaca]